MKKRFLITAGAALASVFLLASCGGTTEEHTHNFKTGWTSDETSHWHEADCGHDEISGKADHTWVIVENAENTVTCTESGLAHVKCNVCNYAPEEMKEFEALGHDYESVSVPATCSSWSYTADRCTRCGDETNYVKGNIRPTGKHEWEEEGAPLHYDEVYHWWGCKFGCDTAKDGTSKEKHTLVDGVCTKCGYTESGDFTSVNGVITGLTKDGEAKTRLTVPGRLHGHEITEIGESAFAGASFTKITLPSSVTKIGDFAFDDSAVQTIEGIEQVTEIGKQAFAGTKIKSFTVPEKVTIINDYTFIGCEDLATVSLGKVEEIGMYAFADCASLTEIEFPNTLSTIRIRAFANSGLTEVEVPATVGWLDSSVFRNCKDLVTASVASMQTRNYGLWFAGCEKLETLTVPYLGSYLTPDAQGTPTGVTVLGYFFETVYPEGVATAPADYATKYTEVGNYYIPNTLKHVTVLGGTVKKGAFDGCSMLEDITIKAAATCETVHFTNCHATVTYEGTFPEPSADAHLEDEEGNETHIFAPEKPITIRVECDPSYAETTTIAFTDEGGVALPTDKYTFTENNSTVTFKEAGSYKVVVTVKDPDTDAEKVIELPVTIVTIDEHATAPTEMSITVGKNSAAENEEVTVSKSITYAEGDAEGLVDWSVLEKNGEEGFQATSTANYEFREDNAKVVFLLAGTYKIQVQEITEKGASVTYQSEEITVSASEISVEWDTDNFGLTAQNSWYRIVTNSDHDFPIKLNSGYAGGYELTVECNGVAPEKAAMSADSLGFCVMSTYADALTFKVTLTHKVDKSKTCTLADLKVSFVSDLANSPILAEDPFGDSPDKIVPGVGFGLYFDVKDKDNGDTITVNDITYAAIAHTTEKDVEMSTVAGDNGKYPYVIVKDFDGDHQDSGTVTVRMTITKGDYTAGATKVINVTPLTKGSTDYNGLNAFYDEIYPGTRGDIDFDSEMIRGAGENAVLVKGGLAVHRTGADSWYPNVNLFRVQLGEKTDYQLDLDYTIFKRRAPEGSNKASFAIRLLGKDDTEIGNQFAFYAENQNTSITAGNWTSKVEGNDTSDGEGKTNPEVRLGEVLHIRMQRKTEGSNVRFIISYTYGDPQGASYTEWFNILVASAENGNNLGAPAKALRFWAEDGTFMIENVKLTDLSAD